MHNGMYAQRQTRLLCSSYNVQAAEELHFATFCQDWCQTFMITDSWKSPVKAWSLPGSGLMIQNYRLRRVHIVTVSKQSKHPQNTHFIERTSYNACPQPAHSSWDSSIKNVKFSVYGQFGKKEWTGCEPSRCVLWLLMNVNTQRTIY